MTEIQQEDLIQSVADALQFISYYHPVDFIRSLTAAYEREQAPAAKDAIAQLLINSRMCAEGHRPICQDTGIVTVFLKVGMDVHINGALSLDEMVNEGVRRAYLLPENTLRASVLADPAGARKNTSDNTPAVVTCIIVPGDKSRSWSPPRAAARKPSPKFAMLNPPTPSSIGCSRPCPPWARGWCPPGMHRHRHRRHRGESDVDGQGSADGAASTCRS